MSTFLHDFVHSCPKARQQLHEQLEKWHKAKALFAQVLEKKGIVFDEATKMAFMKQIKRDILPNIKIENITLNLMEELIATFIENRKA